MEAELYLIIVLGLGAVVSFMMAIIIFLMVTILINGFTQTIRLLFRFCIGCLRERYKNLEVR